jgi:hypothetical protein
VAVTAVHQVNAQLLDVLRTRAVSDISRFPFEEPFRARFASLNPTQCERLACCGTLLIDVGFSDANRWRSVAAAVEKFTVPTPAHPELWLLPAEAVLMAHSTLLVAWSVLHGARSEAGVLLGTSPEAARIIAGMTVNQLAYVAQSHPHWVRPRWMDAPKVWADFLDFAVDLSPARSGFGVLRCWQLSGGQASWLQSYFEARKESPRT